MIGIKAKEKRENTRLVKIMSNDCLNGKLLCKRTGVVMWTPFDLKVKRYCNEDHKLHEQVFQNLVITPLGVASICNDGVGLFETNRGEEILSNSKLVGIGKVVKVYPIKLDSENIRFNESWTKELAKDAGIEVDLKPNGTVGAMKVPAVSFANNGIAQELLSNLVPSFCHRQIDKVEITSVILDALHEYNTDNCGTSSYYAGWKDAVKFIADRLNIEVG